MTVSGLGGIEDRWRRLGNLRLGKKGERNAPQKLRTFRLTSPSRELIDRAAANYGGQPAQWDDQFEVITERDALDVLIPPMPGAFQQSWELYSGDGRQRWCDGNYDQAGGGPCRCPADLDDRRERATRGGACKPMTHLDVMLPDMPGLGVWRLTTGGYNAAAELGILRPLLAVSVRASMYLTCVLRIEARSSKKPGEPRKDFVVPVVDIDVTSGQALGSMGLLDAMEEAGAIERAALPSVAGDAGEPSSSRGDDDGTGEVSVVASSPAAGRSPAITAARERLRARGEA